MHFVVWNKFNFTRKEFGIGIVDKKLFSHVSTTYVASTPQINTRNIK